MVEIARGEVCDIGEARVEMTEVLHSRALRQAFLK
jgi:hypothetical protein